MFKKQMHQVIDKIGSAAAFDDIKERIHSDELERPQSATVCMILYIYSLDTPLRWYLNDACVDAAEKYVKSLGPFAKAFFEILGEGLEQERLDAMVRGFDYHHPKESRTHPCGFLSQSFLLFKFTYLKQALIDDYTYFLGKDEPNTGKPDYICLPAYACMYPSLQTALQQLDPQQPEDLQPVLFTVCLCNWNGFDGFRLNRDFYSSVPERQEYILSEGFRLHVVKIDQVEVQGVGLVQVINLFNW